MLEPSKFPVIGLVAYENILQTDVVVGLKRGVINVGRTISIYAECSRALVRESDDWACNITPLQKGETAYPTRVPVPSVSKATLGRQKASIKR